MIDGVPSLPPAGLRRAPTKEMLARWLMDAWHDGTEDDIMFDYVCPAHAAPVTTMRKCRVTKTGTRVGHCECKQLFTLLLPSVSKLFGKILHLKPHPNFAVAITNSLMHAIL